MVIWTKFLNYNVLLEVVQIETIDQLVEFLQKMEIEEDSDLITLDEEGSQNLS
jgi:hypothetical protein